MLGQTRVTNTSSVWAPCKILIHFSNTLSNIQEHLKTRRCCRGNESGSHENGPPPVEISTMILFIALKLQKSTVIGIWRFAQGIVFLFICETELLFARTLHTNLYINGFYSRLLFKWEFYSQEQIQQLQHRPIDLTICIKQLNNTVLVTYPCLFSLHHTTLITRFRIKKQRDCFLFSFIDMIVQVSLISPIFSDGASWCARFHAFLLYHDYGAVIFLHKLKRGLLSRPLSILTSVVQQIVSSTTNSNQTF